MKRPVYWLLIPSGLLTSTPLILAAPTEQFLSSSDSYNGNTATTPFTPKSTSDAAGTQYTCLDNISISYAGKDTPLVASCFTQTTGDLFFVGNGHSLSFDNITATSKPGAIEVTADKNLSVSGFSIFSCFSSSLGTTAQGAIKSGGTALFDKNAMILFQKNSSSAAGGAITSKGFSLKGTSMSAKFIANTSTENGGAIESSGVNAIENNFGGIIFAENSSKKHGGAIHSNSTTTISNNNRVLFIENTTTGTTDSSGGAIYCSNGTAVPDPDLKLENNQQFFFLKNSSKVSGGAIYSKKLTITSGGPTLFANNSVTNAAPKGGAIYLDGGECSLTADIGNIMFDGNTIITSGNPGSAVRNAIDLGNNGKFSTLSAKEGMGIFFYDPVTSSGTATPDLTINSTVGTSTYSGKIVFSGERLSEQEKAVAANLKSTLNQKVSLNSGSLILKDGVTLEAQSFTQTSGSSVVMDVGTTLQTPSTNGGAITLTDLSVNISPLGAMPLASAKVSSQTTGQNITVSSVQLISADGNSYEFPIFSKSHDFSSALVIEAPSGTTPTVPASITSPILPDEHYGSQGYWTMNWNQGTGTTQQLATFSWTETGYSPNPERQALLVPNALWGSFTDIRALHQLVELSARSVEYQKGLWGSAITDCLHKKKTSLNKKYCHVGVGYAVGASIHTPRENLFSLGFCQLFNRDKDYLVSKTRSHVYAGSLFFEHRINSSGFLSKVPVILNLLCSYCHGENDMTTRYSQLYSPRGVVYPEVKGCWGSNCYAGEISTSFPMKFPYLFEKCVPFLKVQMIYGEQDSFQEPTSEGRSFESSHLANLSLPIGVKFETASRSNKDTFSLMVAYIPDVYRSNPQCLATLVSTGSSWETTANDLARHAFSLQALSNFTHFKQIGLFGNGGFELREDSYSYNLNFGGRIRF
ncbi:polymorphic outer membrane protein middle domain-containing protein [Chlamydia vaughanii]|uniref:polymorphic outer membrane protein middle domain-containing protein n=1 Tax=Chlamydia vaughanii TaxID=3112552 RepID=UPI0032B156E6